MRRYLIAYGLLWVFLYCLHGLYLGSLYGDVIGALYGTAGQGDLKTFWSTLNGWNTIQGVHAHGMGLAILVLLVAGVWEEIYFSPRSKTYLGTLWMIGITLHSVANLLRVIPALVLGDLIVMGCVAASFAGVVRGLLSGAKMQEVGGKGVVR
ncbi:hypothetical protein [Candidatus Formimonas warabiya]|uniref:Uncharacterized protein n=1 Tax=Formimonas warabiya TaxID=1761012 RepID=A0A3G1L038_FORW1|nr:hypothetical protein [Candidatus Formimonas warabiya]ATW27845.1 hypothetical protein DCMF_26585 [Candidatus Formimonas warabiya]